jgi:hypothetical protein
MFSTQMRAIYQRLLILGLLSMCLFVFGFSDEVETVRAAPCIQECETTQGSCNSECNNSCLSDRTKEECDSCILSCRSSFHNCMRHAIDCTPDVSQPGRCSVNYGSHCPIISGQANCSHPDAYNAYFLICQNLGGGSCVSCPGERYCVGSGGQPGCFAN